MSASSTSQAYWSTSWKLLTQQKGWIKPLLVLGAANLVPIAGALGLQGYALEWARLTAWGVDSAPKQKNVQVGACIASGWRGFVSQLGYALVLVLITDRLTHGGNDTSLIAWILDVLAGGLVSVAALRAAIYQNFAAGYRLDRIFQMVWRDLGGFLKVIVETLVVAFVTGLIGALIAIVCLAPALGSLVAMAADGLSSGWNGYFLAEMLGALGGAIPILLLLIYMASILYAFTQLVQYTMWGLWMRQFDVPSWGASGDPLPEEGSGQAHELPPAPTGRDDKRE